MKTIIFFLFMGSSIISLGNNFSGNATRNQITGEESPAMILTKAIEAHGGKDNILKHRRGFLKGIVKSPEGKKTFQEIFDLPAYWKQVGVRNLDSERQRTFLLMVNGDFWEWEELGEPRQLRNADLMAVPHFGLIMKLIDICNDKYILKSLGKESETLVGFRVEWEKNMADLYFDEATGLLIRSDRIVQLKNEKYHQRSLFSDYKQIDGVKIPFRRRVYLKGKDLLDFKLIADIAVTEVKIVDAIPKDTFSLPDRFDLNSKRVLTLVNQGRDWIDKKDFDKAITDLDKAVRLNSNNTYAFLFRGVAWYSKKEYDKAITDYNEAIRVDPINFRAFSLRGVAWNGKKEYDKAIMDFDEVIRLDPENATAFYNRAISWEKKKEIDKAILDYNEAIHLDPKNASAFINRGIVLAGRREYQKAILDFDEAIRLNPNNPRAFHQRGIVWIYKQEYDKAIRDLDETIRLDPEDGLAYFNRGITWANQKEYDKAIKDYNEVIRLNPKNFNAFYNKACCYAILGKTELAIEALRQSLDLGFPSFDHMAKDRFLEPIRDDPRFKELLKKYAK